MTTEADSGRPLSFWVKATLIGLSIAPLSAFIVSALIVVGSVLVSGISETVMWVRAERGSTLLSQIFIYALPVAPLAAVCVPIIYRRAAREGANGRPSFLLFGAFAGFLLPWPLGALISLATQQSGPAMLGALYSMVGGIFAPLCGLVIWPMLRRLDMAALAERRNWPPRPAALG